MSSLARSVCAPSVSTILVRVGYGVRAREYRLRAEIRAETAIRSGATPARKLRASSGVSPRAAR